VGGAWRGLVKRASPDLVVLFQALVIVIVFAVPVNGRAGCTAVDGRPLLRAVGG